MLKRKRASLRHDSKETQSVRVVDETGPKRVGGRGCHLGEKERTGEKREDCSKSLTRRGGKQWSELFRSF